MHVQGVGRINYTDASTKKSPKPKSPKANAKAAVAITDSFQPSAAPERTELLSQVRKKIGSGYYNSDSVLDDLSHGFADVFNKI